MSTGTYHVDYKGRNEYGEGYRRSRSNVRARGCCWTLLIRAASLKQTPLPLSRRNIGYTLAAVLAFVGIPSVCVLYGGSNAAKALGLSWQVRATAAPLSVKRGSCCC